MASRRTSSPLFSGLFFAGALAACSATAQDLGNSDPSAAPGGPTDDAPPGAVASDEPASPSSPASPSKPGSPGSAPAFVAGVPFEHVSSDFGDINGLWGSGTSEIWGVGGANGIARFDGAQWSWFRTPSSSILSDGYGLGAVWGTGPTSAWAVGTVTGAGMVKAQLFRWTGSDWVIPAARLDNLGEFYLLNGVWASGDEDVWVAGATDEGRGFAARLQNGAWQKLPLGVGTYLSIWGSDAEHVWIGGQDKILAWDGASFTPVSTGLSSNIMALTGTSATDVWAFGTSGLARHWDGTTWTTTPMGAPITFMGAFARAANDVYAVGQLPDVGSVVAHWDGTRWTRGSVRDGKGLKAVWGNATEIWAMGLGVVYRGR